MTFYKEFKMRMPEFEKAIEKYLESVPIGLNKMTLILSVGEFIRFEYGYLTNEEDLLNWLDTNYSNIIKKKLIQDETAIW